MIEKIKNILYTYFDIEEDFDDNNKGCYINGKWLSIKNILEILEEKL